MGQLVILHDTESGPRDAKLPGCDSDHVFGMQSELSDTNRTL